MRSVTSEFLQLLKTIPTRGKKRQSFIGAGWLVYLLRVCPRSKKRALALRVLGLSTHYFYRHINPEYYKLSYSEFLEAEYTRNKISREKIFSSILSPYLDKQNRVLDYGCGAGFLAKIVSAHVQKVYAVDVSLGVLECARILNSAENIDYLHVDDLELNSVPDASLDIIYSFAVVQHVTSQVFKEILKRCFAKLKPGGKIVFHVKLEDPDWKSEEEWRADASFVGKIKFRYGMHCFSRKPGFFYEILPRHGFTVLSLESIESMCDEKFDDICSQHLLTAVKD